MKEVRELMIEEKMPFVLQQIITWVGEYGIKIAIIVENFALQEKVVIALRQQQIGCCVYEIKYNDSER